MQLLTIITLGKLRYSISKKNGQYLVFNNTEVDLKKNATNQEKLFNKLPRHLVLT